MDAGSHPSQPDNRLRRYQALFEAIESITAHRDLPALLQEPNERLQPVIRFDHIHLLLDDPKSKRTRLHVLDASPSSTGPQLVEWPNEEAPSEWVRRDGQPLLVSSLGGGENGPPHLAAALHSYGINAACFLPLTSGAARLGALGFGSLNEAVWSEV